MTAAHPTTFIVDSRLDQPALASGIGGAPRRRHLSPAVALAVMTGTSFALWAGILVAFLI